MMLIRSLWNLVPNDMCHTTIDCIITVSPKLLLYDLYPFHQDCWLGGNRASCSKFGWLNGVVKSHHQVLKTHQSMHLLAKVATLQTLIGQKTKSRVLLCSLHWSRFSCKRERRIWNWGVHWWTETRHDQLLHMLQYTINPNATHRTRQVWIAQVNSNSAQPNLCTMIM